MTNSIAQEYIAAQDAQYAASTNPEIQALNKQIAEIEEELDFYVVNFLDFEYEEYEEAVAALNSKLDELQDARCSLDIQDSTQQIVDKLQQDLYYVAEEFLMDEPTDYNPCEPTSYDVDAIEVAAEPVEDDSWLLEEWNAICDDPAGERFQRPRPVFQSFMHYVMFVLGILGKTVSNYLSWDGYGINTNNVIA